MYLPEFLKYPKLSKTQLKYIEFNGKGKRNKCFYKYSELLLEIFLKPKIMILNMQSKNSWLEVIEFLGLKEHFKITDNKFIYIENSLALIFKTKQELLQYKGIKDSSIENADGTIQECSDLLKPNILK